jgi:hypothetical protein
MPRKLNASHRIDVEEALEILYGNEVPDLTSQGYQKALERLRSIDKDLAKRIERVLNSVLKNRFFSRRQKEWFETSEATRARLALLSDNPHFNADVHTVRAVLQIPTGHIQTTQKHPLWKQLQDIVQLERIRRVVDSTVASVWLDIHRRIASGLTAEEEDGKWLSRELYESAIKSAGVDLQAKEVTEWLHHQHGESQSFRGLDSPIDWFTYRLVYRHRLPHHIFTAITMFILTQDKSWIEGLEPLHIDINHDDSSEDPEAFNITVRNVDEFITKDDWDRVWNNYVKPRQNILWEKRGMRPKGRRTRDILRLKESLPFYQKMVETNSSFNDIYYSHEDYIGDTTIERDSESLRKTIHDLESLLTPRP